MEGITFFCQWEVILMEYIQHHIGSFGVMFFNLCSALGEEIVMIFLLGLFTWCFDKKLGRYIGVNLVTGLVWNPMLKNIVLRRRPYFDHPGIQSLRPVEKDADLYDIAAQGYSFPSGHSTDSAICYGSIGIWYRKIRWIRIVSILIPFLVGLSRIVTGNHYPTDVLAGWALGIFAIFVSSYLQKKIQNRKILYTLLFLTAVPGVFYCTSTDYYTCLGIMGGFFLADLFADLNVTYPSVKTIWEAVLRILGGIILFILLSKILKLPFSAEFLESTTMLSFLVRTLRYLITVFLIIGIYPLSFTWLNQKLFCKNGSDVYEKNL